MATTLSLAKAHLTPAEHLARVADPTLILRDAGEPEPHPEQVKVLRNWRQDHYLLWTRQGGKSSTGAALACHNLLFSANADIPPTVVVVSRAERQSGELFRKARSLYGRLSYAPPLRTDSATVMETHAGGRILAYPGSEESVRGLSAVTLALIGEATLVPRELRDAISPMMVTTNAPLWCMATAKGEVGWFYAEWTDPQLDYAVKSLVICDQLAHLSTAYLEKEKRRMPSWQFDQEYLCRFVSDGEAVLIDPALIDAMQNTGVQALW